MTNLRFFSASLACAAAVAAAAAGCDSMADGHYEPAFGTIQGTITSDHQPDAPLRIALVWLAVNVDQGAFEVAQDVPVEAPLPTRYRIDVTELPPDDAITGFVGEEGRTRAEQDGLDPDMRWAQAAVLAYTDGNENDHLDLTDQYGDSPDHVVGKAEGITVWFLEDGTPAPSGDVGALPVTAGLSVSLAPYQDPAPGDCSYDDDTGHYDFPCSQLLAPDRALLPLPATVDLALTDDPHLDHYTCGSFWGSDEWPDWASDWNAWSPLASSLCDGPACQCDGYDCPLDLPPAGAPVTCNAAGTAYTYKTCVDDPDVCGTRFCHYGHAERPADQPAPAAWPCP